MTADVISAAPDEFVVVPGDRTSEVGHNLAAPVPRALSMFDQFGLWGNMGVSLLGFSGAMFVLQPVPGAAELSLAAGLTAILVGTLVGTLPVAMCAVQGARTGAPAMVLLRGLFGARLSYLPTLINIVQCLGWAIFELVTISAAADAIVTHVAPHMVPHWAFVVFGGLVTGVLTVHPLGAIRVLRRYATVAVLVVMAYLLVEMLRQPLPAFTHGTWSGFWQATDSVVGAGISWVPLAADYSRHSRTSRDAFAGVTAGYSLTQILCYAIGLFVLVTVAHGDIGQIWGAFIALPVGALAFAVLAVRELDQSFADVYSAAVSVQNLRPLWDRRVLAAVFTAGATAGALWFKIDSYQNFLFLLGAVFVPLSAVLIMDYFVLARGRWDVSVLAPTRWLMLLPWLFGFVTYQLINPGQLGSRWGWTPMWTAIARDIHFTAQPWMSASILSFAVAAAATLATGVIRR